MAESTLAASITRTLLATAARLGVDVPALLAEVRRDKGTLGRAAAAVLDVVA